jgi:hypothetical protein
MKILKLARKGIKGLDVYGYSPNLKYKGKSQHKTIIGGIFSGFIKAFLALYIYQKVYRLIVHGDDFINITSDGVNVDEMNMYSNES